MGKRETRFYRVKVIQTFECYVDVEAYDREHAEQIVSDDLENDCKPYEEAMDFISSEIKAVSVSQRPFKEIKLED